jgi:N-terminal domain on NACHT_NTPase and P-loop NTPases
VSAPAAASITMSGAEAAFVLQTIGNCIELLKVINTVVRKARAFNKDRYEVPRQFRNLQAILGLLHVVLERVKDRQKLASVEAAHQARLKQIISNCRSAMAELWKIFKKHHLQDNTKSTSLANLKRAIQAVAGESDVAARRDEIQQYIQAITAFTSAFQPTAKEIAQVVTSELDGLVDRRVSEFAVHLKVSCFTMNGSRNQTNPRKGAAKEVKYIPQFKQGFGPVPGSQHPCTNSSVSPEFLHIAKCNLRQQHGPKHDAPRADSAESISIECRATESHASNIYGYNEDSGKSLHNHTAAHANEKQPVQASQPAPGDWSIQGGVASRQFEPSIMSHRSHAGPEPDPAFLHPQERLHRSNSGASGSSCSSSTHSSTRVPSVFSDGDKPPFPSPLSDNGQPFGTSNSHIDPLDPNRRSL